MTDHADEPLLLTPGPITVSRATKEAMLRDWGSRDGPFIAMTERVQSRLVELVGGATSHVAVLLQGSGTYADEAMIGTLVPRDGKLLILINGAYGVRMAQIARITGRSFTTLETSEDTPPDAHAVASRLASDEAITHVAMVYCETTSGMLNPLSEVAGVVAAAGRLLLVDAMSAFGALPCDVRAIPFDGLAASFNKCLEGVPGAAFVICRRSALENAAGNAHSFALDLHDQWTFMERTGQWRFTPPTHVIAACDRALTEHAAEGGVEGRGARYRRNCAVLIEGMRAMGFTTLLPDALQAPIIVTFHTPADPRFEFQEFYENLRRRGYIIYPGKLTTVDSFRIGCIGHLDETDIRQALTAIRQTLEEMGVRIPVPAASR
ncbi:MAG: 2-aminoethylphosphonate--pyruvate transaminase [Armatimonadetes bacterium]|nr:2-aminoethylphosphonate--pyruvate transaminase [Armatimonadota bacterium]